MTKQEEIGEELIKKTGHRAIAYDILRYLHSQGVVIKVDRELPKNPYKWKRGITHPLEPLPQREWDAWEELAMNLGYYGYVAVEPLMEG